MRDEQHRPRERVQRGLERLAALEVEMVRRLVEHEEVRAGSDDERKREPPPLAAGERGDRLLVRLPAGEEKAPEQLLRLRARQPGRALGAIEHAAALVELDLVLREVGRHDAVPEADRRRPLLAVAEHRLEQCGLARSRSGRRAPTCSPRSIANVASVEQLLVAGAHAELVRLEHGAAAARGLEELEPERAAAARQAARARPSRPRAPSSSRSICVSFAWACLRLVLLVPEALDEALEPRDVHADALGRLRGGQRARRLLEPPVVPRAGEEERAAGLQLEHAGRDRLEEPAVVRDQDDAGVDRLAAPARATRGSRRRGGSSARRGAAGRDRRRARGRARRASARRRRTSSAAGRGRRSAKPSPRSAGAARSRQA